MLNQRFYAFAIFALVALTLNMQSCFDNLGEVAGALPPAYPASNDPSVTAAGKSDEAQKKENEAVNLAIEATKKDPPDLTTIDKAIALRPNDPFQKLNKAAVLRSLGRNDEAAALEASAYTALASGNPAYSNKFYHFMYAMSLERVYEGASGARKAAALDELCAQVRAGWGHGVTMTKNGVSSPEINQDKYAGEAPGKCGSPNQYYRPG